MSPATSLSGQTTLVTGGGRGIGRAIALALAETGAEVVVNYSSSASAAAEVVSTIQDAGGKAYALQANVAVESEVEALIKEVLERSGRIDVLVNNAGITRDGLMMRMKTDDWQSVLDLNLGGVFLCSRAVIRPMLKQKSGRIINITSVVGLIGNAGQANYAAAKAGMIGLTKTVAKELGGKGITANVVAPGFIKTDMTEAMVPVLEQEMVKRISTRRLGEPSDISAAVAFLASEEASYVTGQVLVVDGGLAL